MNEINLKIIRKPEASRYSGLSKTSLFELSREGLFPPIIKLGPRAAGYLEHEVNAVIAARAAGRSEKEIKDLVESLIAQRQTYASSLIERLTA